VIRTGLAELMKLFRRRFLLRVWIGLRLLCAVRGGVRGLGEWGMGADWIGMISARDFSIKMIGIQYE